MNNIFELLKKQALNEDSSVTINEHSNLLLFYIENKEELNLYLDDKQILTLIEQHKNTTLPLFQYICLKTDQKNNLLFNDEHIDLMISNSNEAVVKNNHTILSYCLLNNKHISFNKKQWDNLLAKANLNHKYDNLTPLGHIIRHAHDNNLYFDEQQIDYILSNTNLNIQDNLGNVLLTLFLECHHEEPWKKLKLTNKQLTYFIEQTNFNLRDKEGLNSLMIAHKYNKTLEITPELYDLMIRKANLKHQAQGFNNFLFALTHNKEQHIYLTPEQIDYFIENSDLTQTNTNSFDALMLICRHNKLRNININTKQLDALIKNSDLTKQNNSGWNSLMFVCRYNKEENLNLTEQQFDSLIQNSILKQIDNDGWNSLMFALRYNKEENLNLTEKQLDHLIENSDLTKQTNNSWNALMFALRYNKKENLNLTEQQLDYLIQNSDLKQKNNNGWNALMFALRYNTEQNLNLTEQQLDYLIQNSDLKQQNNEGWNDLMCALRYNKDENFNLTKKQLNYLIENSNLKQQNNEGWNALMFVLRYNKEQILNVTEKQLDNLIKNSDLQQENDDNWNALMLTLKYNQEQNLNLNYNQLSCLYDKTVINKKIKVIIKKFIDDEGLELSNEELKIFNSRNKFINQFISLFPKKIKEQENTTLINQSKTALVNINTTNKDYVYRDDIIEIYNILKQIDGDCLSSNQKINIEEFFIPLFNSIFEQCCIQKHKQIILDNNELNTHLHNNIKEFKNQILELLNQQFKQQEKNIQIVSKQLVARKTMG